MRGNKRDETPWQQFYGPNLGYVVELYDQYREDPDSIDASVKQLFERWGKPVIEDIDPQDDVEVFHTTEIARMKKMVAAEKLVQNIRIYGHLAADINPLNNKSQLDISYLHPEEYQLSEEDLRAIPAEVIWMPQTTFKRGGMQSDD